MVKSKTDFLIQQIIFQKFLEENGNMFKFNHVRSR